MVSVGQWEKISLKYGFIPFLKRHCSPETKVKLKRAPTRREGGISLWGLCLVSAEQLLFEEGHVKVSFLFRASLQGFACGRREEMEAGNILNHTAWMVGLWFGAGEAYFQGISAVFLWVRNGGLRDVGIGKGNKQELY